LCFSPPALRLWPVFILGRRFSGLVAIQPGHTLVTNGIYGVVRNPSYLGMRVDDRDHSLENATASVASLRGRITATPKRWHY